MRKAPLITSVVAAVFCAGIPLCAQRSPEPASKESQADRPRLVVKGELIKKVPPKYPKQARKKHIEGTVIMQATITSLGEVGDLRVVSGDPLLVQAAMDAVKQWKYRPYVVNGNPVDVETQITVNFQLSR